MRVTKSFIFSAFLSAQAFLVAGSVFSQQAQQPAHKLKVHVSPENNAVYWPQNLPFYVRLSTSPEPSAPSFLLQESSVRAGDSRKQTASDAKTGNGRLDLEMSGNQFMRWVNHATKDTFMLRFVSDGMTPKTSVTFSGAPTFTANDGTVFYGKGLSATLKSVDDHSGVETTFISIDGATFSNYVTPLQFSLEKKNVLAYYGLDKVGNAEPMLSKAFIVDLTAPVSRHALGGLFQATILSNTATITLTAMDNLSGVNRIEYAFDGQDFQAYGGKLLTTAGLSDGDHKLAFRSVDEVNNQEGDQIFQFYADKTPPVAQLTWETDFFSGDAVYVSTRTKFSLQSTDNKSGVKSIVFSMDGASEAPYTQSFFLSNKSGARTIRFTTTDQMENVSQPVEKSFVMDVTPPVTSFSFSGIKYVSRNIHWITSATGVNLKAVDGQSGVARINYTTAAKASELVFEKDFTFPNEGSFTVSFSATDKVANKETAQSIRIIVDNTPPVITTNFGTGKIGSLPDTKNESVRDIYPAGTQLYLASSDASSGLKQILYSLNGSPDATYAQPILLNQVGEFTLRVTSADNLDNKSVYNLKFIVSDQQ